ncbi:hypothetical protein GGTG_13308 [Gaeumannomyces tritici R3-111a-1]|uniref:Uncharacterized protein n=1 Tax=Gaeumannomyces tritici (strain R3-111a-1) TaxID=644352 RepID=J3PII0_GAET3|nr:hypothetical protein GGTG_13308 [Gaeumannomyces tritici R3-111a-1]EJT69199.1 hypothetical protein GGTG_13308 [Gaeumannomyces tritici R3-111a-1]
MAFKPTDAHMTPSPSLPQPPIPRLSTYSYRYSGSLGAFTNTDFPTFSIRPTADMPLPSVSMPGLEMDSSREETDKAFAAVEAALGIQINDGATPIEPFHLEDLLTRIAAAGVLPQRQNKAEGNGPPRLQPPQSLPLLDIPKIVITDAEEGSTTQQHAQQQIAQNRTRQQAQEAQPVTSTHVYLPCSPFTITMPTFRHGPIRLSRSDIDTFGAKRLGSYEMLDLAVLQRPTLSDGTDGFPSGNVHFTQGSETLDVDELACWLDGFGLGGIGGLLSSDKDERNNNSNTRKAKKKGGNDTRLGGLTGNNRLDRHRDSGGVSDVSKPTDMLESSSSHTDSFGSMKQPEMAQVYNGLLIPSVNEPLPGRWDARLKLEGYDFEHRVFGSQHLGEHKQQFAIGSERGDESLPESPMFELDITGEVVPMGKNLSHDLRDFLQWATENVYTFSF